VNNQKQAGTGATATVLDMAEAIDWHTLPKAVRHAAQRHFVDTCGVIIAGMSGDVAQAVGSTLTPQPQGMAVPGYDEAACTRHLKGQEIDLGVDVGIGQGTATVWTCDLTHAYIDINADYRS